MNRKRRETFYHTLIDQHWLPYHQLHLKKKSSRVIRGYVKRNIIDPIYENGGLFLEMNDETEVFEEIREEKVLYVKVMQALRDRRKSIMRTQSIERASSLNNQKSLSPRKRAPRRKEVNNEDSFTDKARLGASDQYPLGVEKTIQNGSPVAKSSLFLQNDVREHGVDNEHHFQEACPVQSPPQKDDNGKVVRRQGTTQTREDLISSLDSIISRLEPRLSQAEMHIQRLVEETETLKREVHGEDPIKHE